MPRGKFFRTDKIKNKISKSNKGKHHSPETEFKKGHKSRLTHGHAKRGKKTKTYNVWIEMHHRCNNPNATNYKYYGGRGIKVCERWSKFENFLADMGESQEDLTLDRIDNNGNYEPSNCRWTDYKTSARNRRAPKLSIKKENGEIKK